MSLPSGVLIQWIKEQEIKKAEAELRILCCSAPDCRKLGCHLVRIRLEKLKSG